MDKPDNAAKKKIRVTLTVVLAVTLLFGIVPEAVRGADDLSDWEYRIGFEITNLEDGTINGFVLDIDDFEARIENKVKEDFSDLRVVDEGLNILPYNLADSTMKVLDNIVKGETKTYWLYHGNPGAEDESISVSFKIYPTIIENPFGEPFYTSGCFYASDWVPGYKDTAWEVGWATSDPILPYTYVVVTGDGFFPSVSKTFGQKGWYDEADYTGERFAWKNHEALFTGGAYYSYNEDWYQYLFDMKGAGYSQQRLGFKLTTTTSMPILISYFEIEASEKPYGVYLRETPGVPYDDYAHFLSQTDNVYLYQLYLPGNPNYIRCLDIRYYIDRGDNDIRIGSFRPYMVQTPETGTFLLPPPYHFPPILVMLCMLICIVMDLAYLYYKVAGTKDLASGGEALKGVFVFLIALVIIWSVGYGIITA